MLLEKKVDYKHFIVYLKVLACILITNSHCGDIYPLSFLAVGGSWGNSIFFIISGYCLSNIKDDFKTWYSRRTKRIVFPVILVLLVSILWTDGLAFLSNMTPIQVISYYLNKYWFASAILVFYVFYYFIMNNNNKILNGVIITIIISYAAIYILFIDKSYYSIEPNGLDFFKSLSYFIIFLIGGWIRRNLSVLKEFFAKISGKIFVVISLGTLITWVVAYLIIGILGIGYKMQFIVHVLIWLFAISMLFTAQKNENVVVKYLSPDNKILKAISDSTFEIYLVQVTFIKYTISLDFPINWLLFWGMALGGGVLLRIFVKLFKERKNGNY